MLIGEATHTDVIVLGLTRPGLERTTYHTRGEHANHYATDAGPGTRVSSTNKTDHHDITDIHVLLKVALNTLTLILKLCTFNKLLPDSDNDFHLPCVWQFS